MSNSKLVDYTKLSPNCSKPRSGEIRRITIHHMAGNLSVEQCAEVFSGARQASSNYGIGTDGRVGLYVEECNRAWTSSSRANDNLAVTIEVANSATAEPWPVSDAAFEKLVDLCADICRRNGKSRLLWLESKEKTLAYTPAENEMVLTMHRWFAATSCPGDYLAGRFGEIARRVNEILQKEENSMSYEEWKKFALRYEEEKRQAPLADWAKDAWNRATADGIVDGTAPHAPLTRAEAVIMLERFVG